MAPRTLDMPALRRALQGATYYLRQAERMTRRAGQRKTADELEELLKAVSGLIRTAARKEKVQVKSAGPRQED